VLFDPKYTVRGRIIGIFVATVGIFAAGLLLTAFGAAAGFCDWPPLPSSPYGVACGVIGGIIVAFEMLIVFKKRFRASRVLGNTRLWMKLHLWLGLISFPMIFIHAGFGFGGALAATTHVLFILVILSGIWGWCMQQWLPQKMLDDVPGESIAVQLDRLGSVHAHEAERIISALMDVPPESESDQPVVPKALHTELTDFRDNVLLPYLRDGSRSRSPLTTSASAARQFARLRDAVPPAARPDLDKLEALADLRRRWDKQNTMHFWLHLWLLIHLPISVAMSGFMVLHAIRALKYW
jgi:hypothetical protein